MLNIEFTIHNHKHMELSTILEAIQKQAKNNAPIEGTIKFVLDNGIIYIDGKGEENTVSQEDKEADTTISTTTDVLVKMRNGDLNPMMAVMTGKVKIKGNMGLAMKLQSLI